MNGRSTGGEEYRNMNGRMYDPLLGRMLSPDNYVQEPYYSQSYNRYAYVWNNPLKYTDPTGEYALIDDLIIAIVGGTVNLIVNAIQGNVNSWGQGFSSFGVGFVGAWTGLYAGPAVAGMIIGGGNSFVNQGFGKDGNWNSANISGQQIFFDGVMGGLTGQLGASLGQAVTPYVSNLTSGIGGQAVQQALTQGVTGSTVGFTMNTGFALMSGESFGDALKQGGQGALMGFGVGVTTGLVTGVRSAHKAGENPWTGRNRYPSNDGFLGETNVLTLKPGDVIDRYGGTTPTSRFVSPEGVPMEQRSLHPKTNLNVYDRYQVRKPFSVQSGTIAPYYGQPGGGVQYVTPMPIETMLTTKIIVRF